MSESGSLLVFLRDPRLAAHATANCRRGSGAPTRAACCGATRSAPRSSTRRPRGARRPHHRSERLRPRCRSRGSPARCRTARAPRLERLRGFGGRFGGALMCGCSRVMLADRTPAILVVATEAGRPAPCRSPSGRGACSPAATSRSRCSPPTARCCMRRAARRRGSAAPRPSPRSGARRWPARRSPRGHAAGDTTPADLARAHRRRRVDRAAGDFRAAARATQPAPRSDGLRTGRQSRPLSSSRRRSHRLRQRRSPAGRTCRTRLPAPRLPAKRPPAAAALRLADGCRRPLHARLRRIHRADRAAHRRGARPALERDRGRRSGSIPKARSRAPSPRATPGAASRSRSRSTAATRGLRSNCPACRCSTATAASAAIAASASAATSRASPS